MFADYVALVKNLRGVVLLRPEDDDAEDLVGWLSQRFRYRNLGLGPSLVARSPAFFRSRLRGRPFVELTYPLAGHQRVTQAIAQRGDVKPEVAETIVLASVFASPIVCLGQSCCADLRPLCVDEVETRTALNDKDWRLHFRIADYTVLDLYRWSTDQARQLWHGEGDSVVATRRERIAKDTKRYWRLAQGDGPARPFLCYLDIAARVATDRALREEIAALPEDEASAALAVVPAVVVM